MDKKILFSVFALSLFIAILFISEVFAITGSIGNARMILRAKTGDKIEKYILVKNAPINNVSLDIELSASGDLEKYITIKDDKFSLAPDEEKKAYFTIQVEKEGATESKINVKFTPEEGQGVGLSSTVIVIAEKTSWWSSNDENNESGNETWINVIAGKAVDSSKKANYVVLLFLLTAVIFIIFVVLLIAYFTRMKKSTIKLKKSVKTNA